MAHRVILTMLVMIVTVSCGTPQKTSQDTTGKKTTPTPEKPVPEKVKKKTFSQDDVDAFVLAVRTGDADTVVKIISDGIAVTRADNSGNTPLHWAAHRGDSELVKLLVQRGADVNARDGYRNEPVLMWAVKKGRTAVVKFLLENGADINLHDKYKETALMDAARYGHMDLVKMLIHRRANVNDRASTGDSALMYAASNGYTDIVQFLMKSGANINFVNYRTTESALALAKRKGNRDIVKMIRRQARTEGKLIKRPEKPVDKGFVNEPPGEKELYAAWKGQESELPPTLSQRYISMHMKHLLPRITKCYQKRYRQGDRNMMGTMEMELRIAGNGDIVDAYFTTEKYQSSLFGDCILEVVHSRKFPMFHQGVLIFKYQYTF